MRIVQFSDLHLGESAGADNDTLALMRAVLTHERPELVIFIGDQVSGFDALTDAHRLALWGQAVSVAAERQLPFATLFGNHDDQPYHLNSLLWNGVALLVIVLCSVCALCWPQRTPKSRRGVLLMVALVVALAVVVATMPSRALRRRLGDYERALFPAWSRTGVPPYRMTTPDGPLYFLDSGGGAINEGIGFEQIAWLQQQPPPVEGGRARAFMHIPPSLRGLRCDTLAEQASPGLMGSERLLEVLAKIGVDALYFGHDHANAGCCRRANMTLCYGKHSGFGGYDTDPNVRGARVIEANASRLVLWDRRTRAD
jgi:hypothetical protein